MSRVAVILAAVFLTPLSVTGTAIVLPAIAGDLGAHQLGLQLAVNGFNVAFAIFTFVWGVVADRLGYRRTFVVGLSVLATSSVVSGLAPTWAVLDVGRFLAGIGCAGVIAGGAATLSYAYPGGPQRTRNFALFGTTVGAGLAFGPAVSGGLAAAVGWRGVYVAAGVIATAILVASPLLPRSRARRTPHEKNTGASLLKNRRFVALVLVPVAPAVGYVTVLTYLPVGLAALFGTTAAESGLVLLPMTIPVLVGPLLAAVLSRRFGTESVLYVALAALVLGDLGMLLLAPGASPGWLVMPMALVGFGYGLPMGLVDSAAMSAVPERRSGTAVGVLNFVRTGSAAVAVGAYGVLIATLLNAALPADDAARVSAGDVGHGDVYAHAFHTAQIVMALTVAALGVIIVRLLRTSRAENQTSPVDLRKVLPCRVN